MKVAWTVAALVALTCVIQNVHSAKILIYMGMSSPSHKFAFLSYVQELTNRGHQITFISPFATEGAKFRDISPKSMLDAMASFVETDFIAMRLNMDVMTFWMAFRRLAVDICEAVMKSPEVDDIVLGKEKFDMVIIDPLATECGLGFAYVSDAPVVYFHTAGYYPWTLPPLGLPSTAVFTPSYFVYNTTDITRLTTRAVTAISNIFYEYQRHWYVFPTVENMWSQRLGRAVPSFYEMEKDISLLLLNTHRTVEFPIPYMPNAITVGGIHLQPHKPLPKDLEDIASGSGKDGFILFSLGSIVQAKNLPPRYYQAFLQAFQKLPQRIIWKWEVADQAEKLPSNVFLREWIPQYDLLAHPNCRGFVTHGGKLGFMEATQEGVPVVVIPFFADQDLHGSLAEAEGFGIYLDLSDVTADSLYQAISSIVKDSRYKKKAKERSQVFKDEPDTPLSRAIFWTEYVLRHPQGASLRPEASNFTWYQYHLVDVWLLVALIILVPVMTVLYVLRCLFSLVCPKSNSKKKKIKSS